MLSQSCARDPHGGAQEQLAEKPHEDEEHAEGFVTLSGDRLISRAAIERMCEVQSRRKDMLLGFEIEWAMGLALNTSGALGPNPKAFGHTGWGGSFAFADPGNGLGAAYTLNRMGADLVGDPRGVDLARAIADCC